MGATESLRFRPRTSA